MAARRRLIWLRGRDSLAAYMQARVPDRADPNPQPARMGDRGEAGLGGTGRGFERGREREREGGRG